VARKDPLQVAQENLETAERVHEKAKARVEKTREAHEKAVADERLAARKVRAARIVAVDEETDAIDPEPSAAVVDTDDDLV
jgi:IS5 family transposase